MDVYLVKNKTNACGYDIYSKSGLISWIGRFKRKLQITTYPKGAIKIVGDAKTVVSRINDSGFWKIKVIPTSDDKKRFKDYQKGPFDFGFKRPYEDSGTWIVAKRTIR